MRSPSVDSSDRSEAKRVTVEEVKRHREEESSPGRKWPRLATKEVETDPRRLEQRRKEIRYGKNTLGYDRYTRLVSKQARKRGDPRTPDVTMKVSKRQFDGIVRDWRRKLHQWDPPQSEEQLVNPTVRRKPKAPAAVSVAAAKEHDEDDDDDGLGPDVFSHDAERGGLEEEEEAVVPSEPIPRDASPDASVASDDDLL